MMAAKKFTVTPISDKYTQEIINNSFCEDQSNPEIIINPSGCILNLAFRGYIERIQNFKVYPDDIWVITFPKCGTTWTQEMVWLLRNNLNFEEAKSKNIRFRVPFFEFETILSKVTKPELLFQTIEYTKDLPRPRCIKSHLPLELLPQQLWTVKPKIVYVLRDPKDVAISYYHHHRLWNGYEGTLENFVSVFLADKTIYCPFWKHIIGFFNIEDKSHILFNTFEEMKEDLSEVIRKTAKFLEIDISDEKVEELREHLSFKSMQKNSSVNYDDLCQSIKKTRNAGDDENLNFIRKGESGAWKNVLTDDILVGFKKWDEHHLKEVPFKDYEDLKQHL